MKKIIFTVIIFISNTYADSGWDSGWYLEQKSPSRFLSNPISHQVSPDGKLSASLYESTDMVDEGESPKQYLQIRTPIKYWWMSNYNELPLFTISRISFIANKYLLLTQITTTVTLSNLINIETKQQKILGGGAAEYIEKGENKGLFILHDSKGYFPAPEYGAFWVDKVRNKKGELIEVLSKPKNSWGCIPLKSILDENGTYPALQQKMEDCVYVDR